MHTRTLFCSLAALLALVVFLPRGASALMPPHFYAEASEKSKIKAIGVITKVELLEAGEHYSSLRVTFEREYSIGGTAKEIFTGTCKTLESEAQRKNMLRGGFVYFYPRVGQRVFVTIADEGGDITSMTGITPELENVVREQPYRLEYGVSEARIREHLDK